MNKLFRVMTSFCLLLLLLQVTIPRPHQIRCDCVECVSSSEVSDYFSGLAFAENQYPALVFNNKIGHRLVQCLVYLSALEGRQSSTFTLSTKYLQGSGLAIPHRIVQ